MQVHVHALKQVSNSLGLPVWIVREDLCVLHGAAGSKVRKLARILESARSVHATDLVTCGTTGSHHVHAASRLGHAENLVVHAVLVPQPETSYGRLIHGQTRAINENLTYVQDIPRAALAMRRIFQNLKRAGRRPYLVLPGGSNPEGVSAYADAALSVCERIVELGADPAELDGQVCAFGTGGITAGLVGAGRARKLPAIHAVQIYPGFWNSNIYIRSIDWFSRRSLRRKEQAARPAGGGAMPRDLGGGKAELYLHRNFMGAGYGSVNPDCEEAVALFAEDEIFLDPVYMARAGQALIQLARSKSKPRSLLLWYTAPGIRI